VISSHFIRASKKGQNNGIKLVITNGGNTNLQCLSTSRICYTHLWSAWSGC